MSTVTVINVQVFCDSSPDKPCADIWKIPNQTDYSVTTFTGSNSVNQAVATYDAAVAAATAHADLLDADDGKDTNLNLRFKIRELEQVIADLRARQGDVAELAAHDGSLGVADETER